jgi:hypothetical protein
LQNQTILDHIISGFDIGLFVHLVKHPLKSRRNPAKLHTTFPPEVSQSILQAGEMIGLAKTKAATDDGPRLCVA